MKKIEIKILNPDAIKESEKMMVCGARLTQRGHQIKNMDGFIALYEKGYTEETACNLAGLPHNTIKQFQMINVAVVGASRRFLAQITRRRVGVTFMSASLQYSDYSGEADFVVPYAITEKGQGAIDDYLMVCQQAMTDYQGAINLGIDNDAAGYMTPQGLRNILIISATPQAWIEMISQRVCKRNTAETRYVMLRIWERLSEISPVLFGESGTPCLNGGCKEGKMTCGQAIEFKTANEIIKADYPLIYER